MSIPIIHPKRSTYFRGTDMPESDRNRIPSNKQESRFVRCQFCSAINDKLKRPKGDGWGGNIDYTDSGATATTLKKPVVGGAGCWFCGSSNYY